MSETIKFKTRATLTILFAICTPTYSKNQPCTVDMSVELKNRSYNGVLYEEGEYFVDKSTGVERGCICMKERCVRKCCSFGQAYDSILKECVNSTTPFEPPVQIKNETRLDVWMNFDYVFGRQDCDLESGEVRLPAKQSTSDFYLKDDGTLYVSYPVNDPPWLVYGPDKYCIDTFLNDFKTDNESGLADQASGLGINAMICFSIRKEYETGYGTSSICMLISCFFILLTVAVYAWLPELRNLHGMVLMAHLLCFFVGFLFMATLQIMSFLDRIGPNLCLCFSFIIFYSLLAAFFWLNVMCYDIWRTFSGNRTSSGQASVRRRFIRYSIYAFSMPSLLTALLAGLQFSDIPYSHPLLPDLKKQGCFLSGAVKLLYMYVPIITLYIANLTFFVLTALKIYQIKSQTKKVLRSKESTTHDQHRKDKQRFSLYIKLFSIMGVNWSLEVISYMYPKWDYYWQFTDAYNVLVGLIIFLILVCKKKTIRLIQKRLVCQD